MVKDGFLESKTTCFTIRKMNDINIINIILHNNQIYNKLNKKNDINHKKNHSNILYDFCEGVKAVWQTGFKP